MKALRFISWSFDVRRGRRHISGVFNLPNGTRATIILDGVVVPEIVGIFNVSSWLTFAKSQKCQSQFRKSNTGQLPWKHISQYINTK
jgi:hypothetical protein